MTSIPKDIEAEITFVATNEGGRRTPVRTGYRPQFHYKGEDHVVIHTFIGTEWVAPGQTVMAYLEFLHPELIFGRIVPGNTFEIREGYRVVAKGRVTKLIKLEESAEKATRRTK
jgi:translation elongation factor EF-Tu-like GTPase